MTSKGTTLLPVNFVTGLEKNLDWFPNAPESIYVPSKAFMQLDWETLSLPYRTVIP